MILTLAWITCNFSPPHLVSNWAPTLIITSNTHKPNPVEHNHSQMLHEEVLFRNTPSYLNSDNAQSKSSSWAWSSSPDTLGSPGFPQCSCAVRSGSHRHASWPCFSTESTDVIKVKQCYLQGDRDDNFICSRSFPYVYKFPKSCVDLQLVFLYFILNLRQL